MTEDPRTPADTPADAPADSPAAASPPTPASEWIEEHEPPSTEAERQAQETIRAVSRLEESN